MSAHAQIYAQMLPPQYNQLQAYFRMQTLQ
jgi:hypothetical protein